MYLVVQNLMRQFVEGAVKKCEGDEVYETRLLPIST